MSIAFEVSWTCRTQPLVIHSADGRGVRLLPVASAFALCDQRGELGLEGGVELDGLAEIGERRPVLLQGEVGPAPLNEEHRFGLGLPDRPGVVVDRALLVAEPDPDAAAVGEVVGAVAAEG